MLTEKQIEKSIRTGYLQLSPMDFFSYYMVSFGFAGLFLYLTWEHFQTLRSYYAQQVDLYIILIVFILTCSSFIIQRRFLRFRTIENILPRKNVNEIIKNIAKELEWQFIERKSMYIIAYSGGKSWFNGYEQIVIIFHNNKILVNSIVAPRSRFGCILATHQNEKWLVREISKANELYKEIL